MDSDIKDFFVPENTQLTHIISFVEQIVSQKSVLRFYVKRNAHVTIELLCVKSTIDITVEIYLSEEGASASLQCAYIADQNNIITIHTTQYHHAPHTKSSVVVRGVLYDASHFSYNGKIRIEKGARLSVASQENKNIVLTDAARVISIPTLEILNHDVKCSHASATGRFNADQLFYAASRGITEKGAHHLLLHAFFASSFTNEKLRNVLNQYVYHE